MANITMIKLNSDNFENTYMSEVAYQQVRLTMSSGDFYVHTAEKITFDEFEESNEHLRQAYRSRDFIHLFDEHGNASSIQFEYKQIIDVLTFKQYSKMMKNRLSPALDYQNTLNAILKVTKNKLLVIKIENLLWALSLTNTNKLKLVA